MFFLILIQILNEPQIPNYANITCFEKDSIFYIISNDSIYSYNDKWKSKKISSDIDKTFDIIELNEEIYLIVSGGGKVFRFENEELNRIDKSYEFNNFFENSLFARNNEIYSIGGYGHFQDHNTIIKFDFDTKEWIKISEFNTIGKSHLISQYVEGEDKLYFGLGQTNGIKSNSIYSFNFKNNQTKLYSEFDIENTNSIKISNFYNPLFKSKENEIVSVDLKNKKYKVYKNINKVIDGEFVSYYSKKLNRFIVLSNGNEYKKINFLTEPQLLGKDYIENDLESRSNLIMLIFVFVITSLFLFYKLFRKRKTSEINLFQLNRILSNKEMIFLNKITDHNEVLFTDLMDFFDSNYSYESKIKKVNTTIQRINDSVKRNFNFKNDLLIIKKYNEDLRMKIVYLNNDIIVSK